jgi:hypothetical protein
MLVLNPLLLASGVVSMRKMRRLDEVVVSFYVNLGLVIVSAILILTVGQQSEFKGSSKY